MYVTLIPEQELLFKLVREIIPMRKDGIYMRKMVDMSSNLNYPVMLLVWLIITQHLVILSKQVNETIQVRRYGLFIVEQSA